MMEREDCARGTRGRCVLVGFFRPADRQDKKGRRSTRDERYICKCWTLPGVFMYVDFLSLFFFFREISISVAYGDNTACQNRFAWLFIFFECSVMASCCYAFIKLSSCFHSTRDSPLLN